MQIGNGIFHRYNNIINIYIYLINLLIHNYNLLIDQDGVNKHKVINY